MKDWLRRWLPAIALILSLSALFRRLLLGEVIYWGTPLLQFYPWRDAAFSALRQGRLPLWNPLVGHGAPLLANYQVAVFYPPNWLHLLLPAEFAMTWVGVLHLVWAGLGMMAYLRALGADRFGQGIGALAYSLSGYLIGRFGFLSITAAVAWLPWLILCVDRLVTNTAASGDLARRSAALAAVVGLLLLAGHAQTAFYSLVLAGLYTLWRIGTLPAAASAARLGRAAAALAAVILGVALAGIQLAPTLELMQASQRAAGVSRDFALTYSFWPWRFLTLLSPNLFGSPASGTFRGYGNYWEDAVYVGLLTLMLAGRAVVVHARSHRKLAAPRPVPVVPFYAAIIPPVFLLALGHNTPLFPWLYDHVPTFNLFQGPTRWTLLAVFALAVLGGLGASGWRTSPRGLTWARRAVAAGLAMTLSGAALAAFTGYGTPPTLQFGVIRLGVMLALAAALALLLRRAERQPARRAGWELAALALLAIDLVSAHSGLNPTVQADYYHRDVPLARLAAEAAPGARVYYPADEEYAAKFEAFYSFRDFYAGGWALHEDLRVSLLPNLGMIEGIPSAGSFDPLQVGAHTAALAAADSTSGAAGIDALRRLNIGVLMSVTPRPYLERLGGVGPVSAYAVPDPWPRALLARCRPAGERAVQCAGPGPGSALIRRDDPAALEIVVSSPAPGTLLLLDTDYPGWQAAVDAHPVPIQRANGAFRAVEVPAGEHIVTFDYRPASLRTGALVSALALAAWTLLLGWGRLQGRQLRSPADRGADAQA